MGKKKTIKPASSVVRIGGQDVAKTWNKDNTNYADYILTPEQKQLQDFVQSELLAKTKTLDSQSAEYLAQRQSVNDARKRLGVNQINETYNPMFQNTMNDVYNSQGTLKSSRLASGLNDIEKSRAEAINNFEDQQLLQNEQYDTNALNQKYAYLNYLLNGQTQQLNNQNTGIDQAQQGANALTAVNQANTQIKNSGTPWWKYALLGPFAESGSGQAAASAASAALMASDIRMKQNIKKIDSHKGINIYEFEYKPEFNLPEGKHTGVMAQEIENIIPDSVIEINGYKHVDYAKVLDYLRAA